MYDAMLLYADEDDQKAKSIRDNLESRKLKVLKIFFGFPQGTNFQVLDF